MPDYKSPDNAVHFLDSDEFMSLLPPGSVPISKAEATAIQNPPLTIAQIVASFSAAIQQHLDDFARTRNYDGILSACTYATSSVEKFRAEGLYAVLARDLTWSVGYGILAGVEEGLRSIPTEEEVMAELPLLAWPASNESPL